MLYGRRVGGRRGCAARGGMVCYPEAFMGEGGLPFILSYCQNVKSEPVRIACMGAVVKPPKILSDSRGFRQILKRKDKRGSACHLGWSPAVRPCRMVSRSE